MCVNLRKVILQWQRLLLCERVCVCVCVYLIVLDGVVTQALSLTEALWDLRGDALQMDLWEE